MKRYLAVVLLVMITIPARAQEPAGGEMSLNDAISLALKNNLSIEVETYNPEIRDTDIMLQKSRFEPLFAANLGTRDANIPSGSSLFGSGSVNTKSQQWDLRLDQTIKTGTSYVVAFNNSRQDTAQFFTTINPRFDSSLFATVIQPLLRNFGSDVTQAQVRIAESNRIASDYRLQMTIADIALQVEQTYWELVFARGELEVVAQALETAQNLYENNKKQVEVGTMAPLEIVVAEAEVARREQDRIRVQTAISNTEDRLRFLIYGRGATSQPIIPTDRPLVNPIGMSVDEAIQKALAGNPDIKAVEADVKSSQLNSKLAKNELKPVLDLTASFGGTGLGGDQLILGGDDPFNPIVIGINEGSYSDSLSNLFDNSTWAVGFVVGIPTGNGRAEADYARADLQQKQSISSLDRTRQLTIQSVRSIVRNLDDNLKTLDAAKASRVLQVQKLDAEKKKLEVGLSTNYVVLEFTSDLAAAQSLELQAMVEYNKNVAQLQRFFGTIVQ